MRIFFDTRELYFLTQYAPVFRVLRQRGAECHFVAYHNRPTSLEAMRRAFEKADFPVSWFETKEEGLAFYRRERPDWILFGNGYGFIDELPEGTRTAQLYHGIGMKSDVYSETLMRFDVRFVEGPHYVRILESMYPGASMCPVGYAKVDPLFWPEGERPRFDLAAAGLDPDKPTLMYAPTHAPSSFALMADEWPAHFADYNLIVKPHYLSFFSSTRKSHRRKMEIWSKAPNAYVAPIEEFDPNPFMAVSDLLISDASSVLFEFAAMDRPVVWCDFLKLPWSRRGIFRYRLRRRMDDSIDRYRDIAAHARNYRELLPTVRAELAEPDRRSPQRRRYTEQLIGDTDGLVSARIADYLLGSGTRGEPAEPCEGTGSRPEQPLERSR